VCIWSSSSIPGGKFASYRGLPSLRQYVLIAQDRPAIDAYPDPEAPIHFESIGCTLLLREVYDKAEFEAPGQPT
jgi:hypothetical protein